MAKQTKETVETADVQATATETVSTDRYSKEQILASATFGNRRDLLTVLLDDGKEYTTAEVEKVMGDWLNKGVE